MNGHAPAVAFNKRARGSMPDQPQFHRALNDDMLAEILQQIAWRFSAEDYVAERRSAGEATLSPRPQPGPGRQHFAPAGRIVH